MPYVPDTCRACLNEPEAFSYTLDEHENLEMYWFCTSIQVKQDELPRYLCIRCFRLLKKFSQFKKACIRSESILHGVHGLNKSIKTETVEENCVDLKTEIERSTSEAKQENIGIKAEESTDADALDTDFADDMRVYDDIKSTVSSEDGNMTVVIYPPSTTRVKKPMKSKKKLTRTLVKAGRLKKRFNFTCELCNKKFGFRERFEAHMLEHEGTSTSIYCTPCNQTFTTWGGLKRHNDCKHTVLSIDQLTCKLCSKVFKSPRTLKIHYATHGDRKLKICDVCGKGFKSDLTLKAHLETHIANRERRYTCQHCGKKYLSKKTCASHTSRRHSDKRYICHHCSYPFTDKSNLAKHILIHEGKQQLHKCELCLKTYSSQSALVIHRRIHTGERPFLCNYCPKSFSNRRMLVDHQRIHTGEKPHKCLVCEQSFTQRGTMKRHMKVHDRLCT